MGIAQVATWLDSESKNGPIRLGVYMIPSVEEGYGPGSDHPLLFDVLLGAQNERLIVVLEASAGDRFSAAIDTLTNGIANAVLIANFSLTGTYPNVSAGASGTFEPN